MQRKFTLLTISLSILLALPSPAKAIEPTRDTAIERENAKPGTERWDLKPPLDPPIEGYASEGSVAPGQSFHLHIATLHPDDRYRVYVYRLGWYGGDGGRLMRCLPSPDCDDDAPATRQPAPPPPDPVTGELSAGWSVTDVLPVGRDWVSGYYMAVLRVTDGPHDGAVGRIPLIVRGEPGNRSAILVQVPANTWQAYNQWGGKSLYTYNSTDEVAATTVSFDRPYDEDVLIAPVTGVELQAVRFLEREGYDVTYATDADVDRSPGLLENHRLALSIGHDEYWSARQRDAFDRALETSTNLAMLGANGAYWQVRYERSRRSMARVDLFRSRAIGRPECRLFGVMIEFGALRWAGFPATPYTPVASRDHPWLAGTGLRRGDDVPGVVGYEWDSLVPGCFPGRVERLLHAEPLGVDGLVHPADAVRGVARSGARVFASGSIEFSWALDGYGSHLTSQRIQVLMENAIHDLTRPAPPRPVNVTVGNAGVAVRARPRADPRIREIAVYVHPGAGGFDPETDPGVELVCQRPSGSCRDRLRRRTVRYAAVAIDRWGRSEPWFSKPVRAGAPADR
jgi:hypothetical protein